MRTPSRPCRPFWSRPITRTSACAALLVGIAACGDDAREDEVAAPSPLAVEAQGVLDAHQAQQEFPILPNPDDPDCGNVYRNLKFPQSVYEHIQEYHEQKAQV